MEEPTPVPRRVSPTEQIHGQIAELFASGQELGAVLEQVARLGVRLLMQTALEAEVTEWLGRDWCERGEPAHAGYRNGYQPAMTIKTTLGPVELQRPKLRDTDQAFASRLLGVGITKTNALESLVIAGFVRGLSTRDVEATLAEALGAQAALSKSTVSRVCAAIKTEFDTWKQRDLSGLELDYLYSDATFFKMHPNAGGEPVLCAWGITTEGRKVLVGLGPGAAESYDAWQGFFEDLKARGLATPLLGITDGAPGLIRAYEEAFSGSLRQRCVVHKARNTLAKVPKAAQAEVKAAYWSIFDDITAVPGEAAVAIAVQRAHDFEKRYRDRFPAAVSCVIDDLDSLTTHLRFPREHWERTRHTNLLERTFGETRRRSKVIGRLPGERSCLSLVWAELDRASKGWRGLEQTPAGLRLLQDLRRQLLGSDLHAKVDPNVDIKEAA